MQPSASEIGVWVMVAITLLNGLASLAVIVNSRRTQRRSVSLEETFATVPQVEKVASDLEELKDSIVVNGETRRQNIEAKVESVRRELKGDIGGLNTKISDLATELAAVGRNCEMTNQTVNGMTSQILRLAERGRG